MDYRVYFVEFEGEHYIIEVDTSDNTVSDISSENPFKKIHNYDKIMEAWQRIPSYDKS